jgi:hypothetical protein
MPATGLQGDGGGHYSGITGDVAPDDDNGSNFGHDPAQPCHYRWELKGKKKQERIK